jgi:glycosyltransferase involved in cell wall biosynthesis
MHLAIFSHVKHLWYQDRCYGYGPFVREMNLWSNYTQSTTVLATTYEPSKVAPDGMDAAYTATRFKLLEVPGFHLLSPLAVLASIFKVPYIFIKCLILMAKADHIHIRCPGNVGLIACVAQIFFPSKPKSTKYAGNWDPNSQQPWSYRLQQAILRNRFLTRNMQVLVYGDWPNEPEHIRPFISATFYEADQVPFNERHYNNSLQLVFAASLVPGKRPLLTIQIVEALNQHGHQAVLDLFGDGPLMPELQDYVHTHGLQDQVVFHGNQDIRLIMDYYKQAHFNILPSKSEGWPKAVAEGMFFGCVPIATPVSCVAWMLGEGSRGILIEPELNTAVTTIIDYLKNKDLTTIAKAAQDWSQQYTFDRLEADIARVLTSPSEA